MTLSANEWTSFWALMAINALPWLTARDAQNNRPRKLKPGPYVPPRWLMLSVFVAVWVLSHLSMWMWSLAGTKNEKASFNATNWLFYANIILHCAWISQIHERGKNYTVGAILSFPMAGVAIAILILQGTGADSGRAWASFGLWFPVAVFQTILVAYSCGLHCKKIEHDDDDKEDESAEEGDRPLLLTSDKGAHFRRGRE